jgi:hypothetical protein
MKIYAGDSRFSIHPYVDRVTLPCLNGALVSDIVLDTSAAATDTIDYVVTDPTGLSTTSTRTILIEAASAPLVPDSNATTTLPASPSATTSPSVQVATSTAQ